MERTGRGIRLHACMLATAFDDPIMRRLFLATQTSMFRFLRMIDNEDFEVLVNSSVLDDCSSEEYRLMGLALRMFHGEVIVNGYLEFISDELFWGIVRRHIENKDMHASLEDFLTCFLSVLRNGLPEPLRRYA